MNNKNKKNLPINIIFLGAGFSKYFFDLPTSNEMWKMLINDIEEIILLSEKFGNVKNIETNFDNMEELPYEFVYKIIQKFTLLLVLTFLFENKLVISKKHEYLEKLKSQDFYYSDNESFNTYAKNKYLSFLNKISKIKGSLVTNYISVDYWHLCDEISDFININKETVSDIILFFRKDENKSNISQLYSLILFYEKEILNINNEYSFMLKSEINQISKVSIYLFIKKTLNKINENDSNKVSELKQFMNLIIPSLIINFNWDVSLEKKMNNQLFDYEEYLKLISSGDKSLEKIILHCKIHNSIDSFNIISPSILRSNQDKEINILEKYIMLYLGIFEWENNESFINVIFIGLSFNTYDEIFLYKLNLIFKNKMDKVKFKFFQWKKDKNFILEEKNFLSFSVEKWEKFKTINNYLKKELKKRQK